LANNLTILLNLIIMASTSSHSDDCYGENNCVLCQKCFSGSTDQVKVGSKGLDTILQISMRRGDVSLTSYLQSKPAVVYVHGECRRVYTKPLQKNCSVDDLCSMEQPAKRLRSSDLFFNWKDNCYFVEEKLLLTPDIIM
jgi:hypothetical protein